jgi:hypothetical protein
MLQVKNEERKQTIHEKRNLTSGAGVWQMMPKLTLWDYFFRLLERYIPNAPTPISANVAGSGTFVGGGGAKPAHAENENNDKAAKENICFMLCSK